MVDEKSLGVHKKSIAVDEKSLAVDEKSLTVDEKSLVVDEKLLAVDEKSLAVDEKLFAPWKNEECGRERCVTCTNQPGRCRSRNATYSITCINCKAEGVDCQYFGETHRSTFDRLGEQQRLLEQQDPKSALWSHQRDEHLNDSDPNFLYKVLKTYKTSTERQAGEAILIANFSGDLMNRKTEFGMRNTIPRLKTHFRDREWTDREDERKDESPRPSGDHQEHQVSEKDDFRNQFSQAKRKRKEDDREREREVNSSGDRRENRDSFTNGRWNLGDANFSEKNICSPGASILPGRKMRMNNTSIGNNKRRKTDGILKFFTSDLVNNGLGE